MRIFGREPAVWLALIGALVSALSAFWLHLSVEQQGAVGAAAALVVGLVTAVMTGDGIVAAVLGLAKALFLVMVSFGMHLSPDRQAVLYTLLAAALAAFVRTQVVAPVPPAPAPVVEPR